MRSFGDQAAPTLEMALRGREQGVIGLGFAGPEAADWPRAPFAPVFARARAEGLRSLPHAGEMAGPRSLWEVLRVLGADRIGHGVRAVEDPELMAYLREHQVPLEVCPTSNLGIGLYPDLSARDLKLVVYCKTGGRAALAACTLHDMGYLHVKSIAGGFDGWAGAGKPVAKPSLPSFD